jgi:hypothetical protein
VLASAAASALPRDDLVTAHGSASVYLRVCIVVASFIDQRVAKGASFSASRELFSLTTNGRYNEGKIKALIPIPGI